MPPFGDASIRSKSFAWTIVAVRFHLVTLRTTPELSIASLSEYKLLGLVRWHAGYRGDVCIGNALPSLIEWLPFCSLVNMRFSSFFGSVLICHAIRERSTRVFDKFWRVKTIHL